MNSTTIDYFDEWPQDALAEVGEKFLAENRIISSSELKTKVSAIFAVVHTSVIGMSRQMLKKLNRHNYVTPTNYLALVKGYQVVVKEKYRRFGVGQLLFDAFLATAKEKKCALIKWQVLDWNKPALKFYEKNSAIIEKEWWNAKFFLK